MKSNLIDSLKAFLQELTDSEFKMLHDLATRGKSLRKNYTPDGIKEFVNEITGFLAILNDSKKQKFWKIGKKAEGHLISFQEKYKGLYLSPHLDTLDEAGRKAFEKVMDEIFPQSSNKLQFSGEQFHRNMFVFLSGSSQEQEAIVWKGLELYVKTQEYKVFKLKITGQIVKFIINLI
ncbi:hypothetical protein PTTG_00472 [Puccinia triticina 1-1 BBBD Race 1]|uniref:Uncharacterized protein n=2 Tax=Puccinia triticina TaxID=208348 RepID=A0A0C4EIA6_PUCT1|nr:uncharacterized protein PtA15_2A571 [Puccinia triticina]OAV99761.1 hypothetical protein PTTG_00472 [Puccinia triticina 1-1 BBBD Race 1]WAQ82254.1 hypothetical protein PtA15_2A571 [Puccinia triticina]WAR53106.1 hypothetical protein PtB15_2B537 [Puccinia triticina]